MGLCVVGVGRASAPTSYSLAPEPVLFVFSILAFSTLLGDQRTCPVLHGADPLVTTCASLSAPKLSLKGPEGITIPFPIN